MLKRLEEYGKFIGITGFSGIRVENARVFLGLICKNLPADVEIQLFDADLVASWQHLYFAALNTLSAFRNGRNLSKSLAVESALYASSQRQIKKALDFIGVKPETVNVAVLMFGPDERSVEVGLSSVSRQLCVAADDGVLELTEAKIKRIRVAFDVSYEELQAVSSHLNVVDAIVDLIVERVALLSTRI